MAAGNSAMQARMRQYEQSSDGGGPSRPTSARPQSAKKGPMGVLGGNELAAYKDKAGSKPPKTYGFAQVSMVRGGAAAAGAVAERGAGAVAER
eukprot:308975-Prorocentrum_minimum.AAC.1